MNIQLPSMPSMVCHIALALLVSAQTLNAGDSAGAAVQPPDESTKTQESQAHTLLAAVLAGSDTETIQKLLDSGIDLNARAEAGVTAYHAARLLGDLEIAQYLASHGADTNIPIPAPDKLVDALFTHFITNNGPGAAVLVAQNGKVLLKNCVVNRERGNEETG